MTAGGLTLMAVHAHPDDEASSTGGILARYGAEGVRTVVVTCTNGELGDGPEGVKPGEPGHDEATVTSVRRGELERSCAILKVTDLELLGYHDSGMMGWPQNDQPGSFWATPVEEASARLATLIERYRPEVVVTYDERGFYGHPDHIQANRITLAALESTGIPQKLYYPGIPKSALASFRAIFEEEGIEDLDGPDDGGPEIGVDDDLIAATIDCSAFVDQKFEALGAHASQLDNSFFVRLGRERFASIFGRELFVRPFDKTGSPVPEHDLFSGVR